MDKFNMDLTLEPVLANMVKSLAEFFGTTTETVMANAPEFLARYGWYHVITDLPLYIILALILGIIGGFWFGSFISNGKNRVAVFILIVILTVVIVLACAFMPVIIAPEFVGLEHLIYIITGKSVS